MRYSWPGHNSTYLEDIVCTSPSKCTAVGSVSGDGTPLVPLVGVRNGSHWKLSTVPVPKGQHGGVFEGVSCTSATRCAAVGGDSAGRTFVPLAAQLSGGSWQVVNPRFEEESEYAVLPAVACVSATACTAVGQEWHRHWIPFADVIG